MNTKTGYLRITMGLSIVSVLIGIAFVIFGESVDKKTVGLAMSIIGPAVIWGIYGCAYFPFKGFFSK